MNPKLSLGDRVQGIDDALEAVVIHVSSNSVRIRTQEGFELEVSPDALVRIPQKVNFSVPRGISRKKESEKRRKKNPISRLKTKSMPVLEVDLHIEKLVEKGRIPNPNEILDLQLDAAKGQLNFAIRKRIQRVVFIHGVGEGVLKAELHTLLRRFDGIRFGEASYADYGYGATEVYIPQELLRAN